LLRWRPIHQHPIRPDAAWRHWLLDAGSLTQRLIRLSEGDFRVHVLEERWQTVPVPRLKGVLPAHLLQQRMWSRKVILLGQGEPWVLAHSLVPQASLSGPLRWLPKLENRPLGAFLFRHKQLHRGVMELAPAQDSWGRRSVFTLQGNPLLVAEFFLPALIRHVAAGHDVFPASSSAG